MSSTATFTKEATGTLQVEERFLSLSDTAMGARSPYIRAKESLLEYFSTDEVGSKLSDREKAEMLAKLVENMAIQITNSLLQSSITICKEDRDAPYHLAKLVEDTKLTAEQRDKIADEREVAQKQLVQIQTGIDKVKDDSRALAAQTYSQTGIKINDAYNYTNTNKYASSVAQVEQLKANKYIALASSYRKDGYVIETFDSSGYVTGLANGSGTYIGLTDAQKRVAVRNEQAFDDNKRQHAVNSSAAFMSTLLASDYASLIETTTPSSGTALDKWFTGVDYLLTENTIY